MADKKSGEGWGISGFTLAVAGVYSLFWITFLSLPLFITGLIFSGIQIKKKKTKLSLWGLIINIVGILLGVITLIILLTNPELFVES